MSYFTQKKQYYSVPQAHSASTSNSSISSSASGLFNGFSFPGFPSVVDVDVFVDAVKTVNAVQKKIFNMNNNIKKSCTRKDLMWNILNKLKSGKTLKMELAWFIMQK